MANPRTSESLEALLADLAEAKKRCARDEEQLQTLWQLVHHLILLEDPRIDAVLQKLNITFTVDGKQIFPRHKPLSPTVIYDTKTN